jgi:hypothetical protein
VLSDQDPFGRAHAVRALSAQTLEISVWAASYVVQQDFEICLSVRFKSTKVS